VETYKKLLLGNKAWVQDKLNVREDYFIRTAEEHTPEFLWIGCSDSRVPAEEMTGTEPGQLFVHRNIANQVIHTDFNMLSVLQYAVEVMKVKHVVVCGHYGCGGVKTALNNKHLGLINKWLRNIKDVYRIHKHELDGLADPDRRFRRMVELNVQEQVWKLAETSFVQHAWKSENRPTIHGWVYDPQTGHINDVARLEPGTAIDEIYRFVFED
jgi:carbonic anhydrase